MCRLEYSETFLDLMKLKFLSGEDACIDYARIDADVELDDYFAEAAQRDAEDVYFS